MIHTVDEIGKQKKQALHNLSITLAKPLLFDQQIIMN